MLWILSDFSFLLWGMAPTIASGDCTFVPKISRSNFKFPWLVRNFWRYLDCHGAESLIITSFDFQRPNMHRVVWRGSHALGCLPSLSPMRCFWNFTKLFVSMFYKDNYSVSSVGEPNYAIHCFDVYLHLQFHCLLRLRFLHFTASINRNNSIVTLGFVKVLCRRNFIPI